MLNYFVGINADSRVRAEVEKLLLALEAQNGIDEPSRSELLDGIWRVVIELLFARANPTIALQRRTP